MQYFRVLLIVCCILFHNVLAHADVVEAPIGGIQTPSQEIAAVYNTESIALDSLQLPYPILSHTEYFIDSGAKMTVDSVSNEAINSEFKLYNSLTLPNEQGLVWLRLRFAPFTSSSPAYLDLGDNVQGIVNVWEKKTEALAIRIHQADNGMYPLDELSGGGELLIAIEGLPSFWFSPTIQSSDEQLLLYKKIQLIIFVTIGILSLFCFLRGFMEKSDWRFWSGVFGFSALAIAYFGIPATPRGQVISSDLISILALASTLFSLSMIGRYCMTLSFFAKKMDFIFLLLGILGVFMAVFPFLENYSWLVRYIELWQLLTVIPIFLTFCLMLKGIKASARYFLLLLILLSSEIVGILGIGGSVDSSFWAFAPQIGVALGLLLLWLSPKVRYSEATGRRAKGGVNTLRKRTEHSPFDIDSEETIQLTDSLRAGQSEVGEPQPIEVKGKSKKKSKKSEVKQEELAIKETPLEKEEAEIFYDSVSFANSQSCLRIEHALRVPLDAFMHEIYFLEQQVEAIRDERKTVILEHVERLLSIGKDLNVVSSSMPRIILNQPKQQRVKVAFNLQDMLRQVYEKIRYEATNAQIALSWVCSPLVGRWFVGEKDALASMIYQLLSDSIRATKKGLVYLHIQRDETSSNYGRLTFIIGDSGQGKPPLNRSSSLLGKAWELAASHDGEFRVENTVQGLEYTFTLSFIALEDDGITEKRSTIKKSSEDLARDIECVMVVSEDTPDRHMLSFRLEKLPCYTVEAMTLNQCMKNYQESPVGIILLHAGLEEEQVMNFIAEVRAFEVEKGIGHTVIVSFVKDKEHEDFLMRAGCNFTLDKNASKQILRDLIGKLLDDIRNPDFLINLIGSKYTSLKVEEKEIELKKDDMRLDMNSLDSLEGKDSQKKKESRFSFFKKSAKPKPAPIHLSVSIPDEKGGKSEKVTKISVQSTNSERISEPFYNDPKNLVTLPSVNKEVEDVEIEKNAIELTTEMVSYETFVDTENEKTKEKI